MQEADPPLEFRVLGALEVVRDGALVPLGGAKPRALLADLLLHAGEVTSVDRLVDDLWGEGAPGTAAHAVEVYVSQLRRVLDPDRPRGEQSRLIATRPPGYVLDVAHEQIDARRFVRLADEGRAALVGGDAPLAASVLHEALGLWRGSALSDFAYEPFAQTEIARLEEQRLTALEDRIDADLVLGLHRQLPSELEALVTQEPLRERLRSQLMLALYRAGRQADALAAYHDARRTLVDELGVEPGPGLRELEAAILRQDTALLLAPAARKRGPGMHFRRLVTILFVDVVESLALSESLDPEMLQGVMDRYFELVSGAVARHGGTVEKYAGDAVMAAFGVPVAHEDDALRAARAALEIQGGMPSLGLGVRIGIEAGEVLAAGDPRQQRFVTGDVVGTASRLQQLAAAGDIVVGEHAHRLVAHAGRFEALGRLELRGKRTSLDAFRVVEVRADALPFERVDAPLVGRRQELAALRAALRRADEECTARAVVVVGQAGIGKSRLAREFGRRSRGVTVLSGRCPSYGEGITYWPLRTIVHGATGDDGEAILRVLGNAADAKEVAARLGAVLVAGDPPPPAAEIAWAFRRFCEILALRRPLLVVLDDVQWAEPMLLELLERLVDGATGAPILLLCLAREELLEEQPSFLDGRPSSERLVLEALTPAETEVLVEGLGGDAIPREQRTRIVEAAEGNPLFVEQLLALAAESGFGSERPLPETIQALLAARLDRLGPGERAVLERGAVVGTSFARPDVEALLDPAVAPTAARHLETLIRRSFLRAADGDRFRFQHVLIQEAVYRSTPKRLRARLHERFAVRLDSTNGATRLDELVGYHLEQSCGLRAELGDEDRELADRAGRRLGRAGIRAAQRADASAGVNLLGRAVALLPEYDGYRLELLCELGTVLKEAGHGQQADTVLRDTLVLGERAGDVRIELRASVEQTWPRLLRGEIGAQAALELLERALLVFEEKRDHRALARAWLLVAAIRGPLQFQHGACEKAAARALDHYRRTGFSAQFCLAMLAAAAYRGPRPVRQTIARLEELAAEAGPDRAAQANIFLWHACLEAMSSRFSAAHDLIGRAHDVFEQLGNRAALLTDWVYAAAEIDMLEGAAEAAELRLREASSALEAAGQPAWRATFDVARAEALLELGRIDEALAACEAGAAGAAADDLVVAAWWRRVRAAGVARKGRLAEANVLAQDAVTLLESTDALSERAKTLLALADVQHLDGQPEAAAVTALQAQTLLQRKGNVALAERAAAFLDELKAGVLS